MLKILLNKRNRLIGIFLLFYLFSAVGSNVYIFDTIFSIRNILFPFIIIIITSLNSTKVSLNQSYLLILIFLFHLTGVFVLIYYNNYDLEIIKDFFYFSFIPIQLLSVLLLGNSYNEYFFLRVYKFSKKLLHLFFLITIFELLTNIHLPSHYTAARNYTPTAFFTNPNDFSVVTLSIYMLLSILNKSKKTKKEEIFISLIAGFIIFITSSRIAIVLYLFLVALRFISIINIKRILFLISAVFILSIIILQIEVPKRNTSVIERSILRFHSIANIKKENARKVSSIKTRTDIYGIPFREPLQFVVGKGFQSDEKIIQKYRTSNYSIINSHSFFIQSIFDFGWFAFILLICFFVFLMIYSFLNHNKKFFILIILAQMLIINVPSSIIRMPIIWLPFFILVSYYTSKLRYE